MEKQELRKLIKQILINEFTNAGSGWDSNNDISLFHGLPSGSQRFPYGNIDTPENLNRINQEKLKYTDTNARKGWVGNKDVYVFPIEEFVLGLKVEASEDEKHQYHIMDIAQATLDKLREDPQYYSKLTTVK